MTLKPWRELIIPHKNVLEGTFQESEFAADLNKVARGAAASEYQDPVLFFERTFITEGMKLLLHSVVKRLSGKGGDPVVQLQTAFGGGKTHAMLAVYHLARQEKALSSMSGVRSILDTAGVSDLARGHVAVLDGNALSPSQPRKHGSCSVNTLWGEMAWQLGGEEGYRMLEQADRDGTSPGKEILAAIFHRFSPAIVLMDETVAYVRQFVEGKNYPGGTFGSNMAFIQALTEAAGHVPTAMVLASLPESDLEAGGEQGKQALKQIEHLFHRLEAIWKPIAAEEGFEIVRRRLFSPLTDTEARDGVCRAFADLYIEAGNYPAETRESEYFNRLRAAYPIHPEIFDRIYEDWAILENFQRTRGVLRLMAMVVHRLWSDGNQDLMIMPGTMPLHDTQVKNELIRYLPTGWESVVDRDIDGSRSAATRIDGENPRFGALHAARKVARSVFLGSAPTSSGQKMRGINAEHIRLGCTQPGQQSGVFDDSLRRLNDQLYYLYAANERYWFDTQTNLRREAEDRTNRFNRDEHLIPEIGARLKTLLKGDPFAGVHIFTRHEDIPDDTKIRLVVLPPTATHLWKQQDTFAIRAVEDTLRNRGAMPRLNQNRLLFFAADSDATTTVYDRTKRYLAWKSIIDDKDALNLDPYRQKEAVKNRDEYGERLNGAIMEAYRWVIVPEQEPDGRGGVTPIRWVAERITSSDANRVAAIVQVAVEKEMLIKEWSPFHLKAVLNTWYWKDGVCDLKLNRLWDDFCRYPYFPRLVHDDVFRQTVAAGMAARDFFGYSSAKEGEKYLGLCFGSSGTVYLDGDSLLVHPDAAAAQQEKERQKEQCGHAQTTAVFPEVTTGVTAGGEGITNEARPTYPHTGVTPVVAKEKLFTRFHGAASLDPVKAGLQFSKIMEEVVQHFSSKIGVDVTISLEIEAVSSKGFTETVRRCVVENARTLGFNHADFEEE